MRRSTGANRAIRLAEQLGETETLAHALNNVGTSELKRGSLGGRARLERSLALALADGLEEHVARAYVNLAASCVELHDYPVGDRYLAAGIEYCIDRDLDTWLVYLSGYRARSQFEQGDWDAAAESAADLLADPRVSALSRVTALVVTGPAARPPRRARSVVAARRGARVRHRHRRGAAPRPGRRSAGGGALAHRLARRRHRRRRNGGGPGAGAGVRRPLDRGRPVRVAPPGRASRRPRRPMECRRPTGSSWRAPPRAPRTCGTRSAVPTRRRSRCRRRTRTNRGGTPWRSCSGSAHARPRAASPGRCASAAHATSGRARGPPPARTRPG